MARKIDINQLTPKIQMGAIQQNEPKYIRCKVLIVCEGEKTEPSYFRSFRGYNSCGLVFEISAKGLAENTIQVVNKAIELKKQAEERGEPYDSVWAVFDKDNFSDSTFDNAIQKAKQNEVGCAWSNEAFELWYVYHFDARSTGMNRSEYKGLITKRIRERGKKKYTYQKNEPRMRDILMECGCKEEDAIKRAENQAGNFPDDGKFHGHNPCTMVYKLVKQLIGKDEDFIQQINDKLGEK
ncbi:RloB family protein [uncultured Porphyromonas sp.]|uniref:RloB family protein n=1 Tax=uncultured Porphyromonas sp. TaxID=159274 RepID=UPI002613EE55|nr:RloB family protein [uncultured Porphyromonas sp.]